VLVDLSFLKSDSLSCGHTRSVGWAIRDLESRSGRGVYDSAPVVSPKNRRRIAWLFENKAYDLPNLERPDCHQSEHSYRSMYGRLKWDEPAQTMTTGFGSMGQGRYVHPSRRRTITPHEAARIQTFLDHFDFGETRRTELARLVGNAVPPLVNVVLGEHVIPQLVESEFGVQEPAA
jgi:DNA (cytosine-5)-methyltransferase 1